jgi:hypothetical protein
VGEGNWGHYNERKKMEIKSDFLPNKKILIVLQAFFILVFIVIAPELAERDSRLVLLPVFGGMVVLLFPHIVDLIEIEKEERKVKKENQRHVDSATEFLKSHIGGDYKSVPASNEKKSILENFELVIEENFPDLNSVEKDSLMMTVLCHFYSKLESGKESKEIYDEITALSRKIVPYENKISKKTKLFLGLYKHLIKNDENFNSLEELLSKQSDITSQEFEELRLDFCRIFQIDWHFRIADELHTQQEMLEAIRFLIENGEFEDYNINKESLERMYRELQSEGITPTALLLIGNQIPNSLKDYMRECPRFSIRASAKNVPGIKSQMFSVWLFKPSDRFKTIDEFYDKKIKPAIDAEKKNSLITIFPLDFVNVFERLTQMEGWTENMVDCYETINYFKTGLKHSTTPLFDTLIKSRVEIAELLSLIPFNIYTPDIRPSERAFFLKNYSKIKEKLSVDKLYDWAKKTPKEIQGTLMEIGTPSYTKVDKSSLWDLDEKDKPTEKQIGDRILSLSKDIVSNAEKHSKPFRYQSKEIQ